MTFRNIERVEVIEVSLDLAIVFDRIAERNEDVFDPLPHQGDRMQMARARPAPWNGYVEAFAFDAGSLDKDFQDSFFIGDSLSYCLLEFLNVRTSLTAPDRVNTSDKFLLGCKFAFLSEIFSSQVLKFA